MIVTKNNHAIIMAPLPIGIWNPAQVKMFIDRMGSLMKYTESGEIKTPHAKENIGARRSDPDPSVLKKAQEFGQVLTSL